MPLYRLCWALLLCTAGAWADAMGSAATVNGVQISNFRLERYFSEYLAAQGRSLGAIRDPRVYQRLRLAALDDLINKELLWQAAQQQGLSVDEETIDEYLSQLRATFSTPEAFARKLNAAGFDEQSYREYVRHELVAQRMLYKLSRVSEPGENDIKSFIVMNSLPDLDTNENREKVRAMLQSRRQAEAARAALQRLRQQSRIVLMQGVP